MPPVLDLPTWVPSMELVHVGSMKPAHKGRRGDSLEGHGLSVSECPEAWEQIAMLSGSWWSLATPAATPPTFLDWHAVPPTVRDQMLAWAIEQELAVRCKAYRVTYLDENGEDEADEDDNTMRTTTFSDAKEARAEYDFLLGEHEGSAETAPRLTEFNGAKLTLRALRLLSRQDADPDETNGLAAILYCDANTLLDGVYWADTLDPDSLSAPRAVIFPRALPRFQVEKYMEQATNEYVPAFAPEIVDLPGMGCVYRDGRVEGPVDVSETADGRRGLTISEWSSQFRDRGHSVQALTWLREQFHEITANGVGSVDDGVGDIATYYWAYMKSKGLVDELLDDDGNTIEVTPSSDPEQPPMLRVMERPRAQGVSP